MSIVVGRILSGNDFLGSVWMVTPNLALTAHHCIVRDENILPDLKISFPNIGDEINANVLNMNLELDTALLEVTSAHDLTPLVIQFSRRSIQHGDDLIVYGHPRAIGNQYANGYPYPLSVVDPELSIEGKVRVDMSYHGGEPLIIEGMSGGPVVLNNESEYAVGIIVSYEIEAHKVHAVSIKRQVAEFDELVDIYAQSKHIDKNSNTLIIEPSQDGKIRWICSVPPEDVHSLMNPESTIKNVLCFVDPSKLKTAGYYSLMRLFWHGAFNNIKCPDADKYLSILKSHHQKIEELPIGGISEWAAHSEDSSVIDQSNIPVLMDEEEFVSKINNSLNLYMLKQLHLIIEECDANAIRRTQLIGCSPETNLWEKMLDIWRAWKNLLEKDEQLNHQYLTHCLLASACEQVNAKDSMFIGRKITIAKLLKPTIMSLALAASDVDTKPNASCIGNILVEENSGHACGISQFEGGDSLCAVNNSWKTKIVILPFLQTLFLDLWEKRFPMDRNPTSVTLLTDPGIPPLVITGDVTWQEAINSGEDMVRQYYNDRLAEINNVKANQNVGSRDRGMENG